MGEAGSYVVVIDKFLASMCIPSTVVGYLTKPSQSTLPIYQKGHLS